MSVCLSVCLSAPLSAPVSVGLSLSVCLPSVCSGRQIDSLSRQLEEERGRVAQLKRDLEALKKKTKTDHERAQRMVQDCIT